MSSSLSKNKTLPKRQARVVRKTGETDISCQVNLDGSGKHSCSSGIGFFDHMIAQLAYHSCIDITLKAQGDLEIDGHHTVEDCGIALGHAFHQALGGRQGLVRFASAYAVLDESLVRAVVDVGGRSFLHFSLPFTQDQLGNMDCELFEEFFRAFATHSGVVLHLDLIHGSNNHHRIEACFKACALALRKAVAHDPDRSDQTSTKGKIQKSATTP